MKTNQKNKFWNNLNFNRHNTFAVHIREKKYGKVNGCKIQPKADIILVKGEISSYYLEQNNFYLCEDDIEKLNL